MMHPLDAPDSRAPADDHGVRSFRAEDHLVVYDPDNPDCWLQSDTTVDPAR